jgi:hypothetical protein
LQKALVSLAMSMRMVLFAVAALAGLKVWTQDRYVRAAMGEALLTAYRERAQQVCLKETPKLAKPVANPWSGPVPAEIRIGNPGTRVAIWDFDNPLWDVRYRHPHIMLTSDSQTRAQCSYDLIAGIAKVSPL